MWDSGRWTRFTSDGRGPGEPRRPGRPTGSSPGSTRPPWAARSSRTCTGSTRARRARPARAAGLGRKARRVCRCSPRSVTSRMSAPGISVPAVAAAGPEAITARGSLCPALAEVVGGGTRVEADRDRPHRRDGRPGHEQLGQLGSTSATRSPAVTPRAVRPAANARTSAANSPRVHVSGSPSTGTHVRNGRLASTAAHRSTSQPTSRPRLGTSGLGVIPPATAGAGP